MPNEHIKRIEFRRLNELSRFIIDYLPYGVSKDKLLIIKSQIDMCDGMSPDDVEKRILKKIKFFWDIAARLVQDDSDILDLYSPELPIPTALEVIPREPKKPYKLTPGDRKFLKSLRVSSD